MRVLVVGALSMSGKAKKTGSPYAICRAYVCSAIESKQTADYDRKGYGFEVTEVEVDPAAIGQFQSHRFPVVLDLETDMRPQGGKLVPFVVGVNSVKLSS